LFVCGPRFFYIYGTAVRPFSDLRRFITDAATTIPIRETSEPIITLCWLSFWQRNARFELVILPGRVGLVGRLIETRRGGKALDTYIGRRLRRLRRLCGPRPGLDTTAGTASTASTATGLTDDRGTTATTAATTATTATAATGSTPTGAADDRTTTAGSTTTGSTTATVAGSATATAAVTGITDHRTPSVTGAAGAGATTGRARIAPVTGVARIISIAGIADVATATATIEIDTEVVGCACRVIDNQLVVLPVDDPHSHDVSGFYLDAVELDTQRFTVHPHLF
jgi:hypothetical protein